MTPRRDFVIDASVAVKWLVPEPLTPEALLLLNAARQGEIRIHVPEIWLSEIASSLLKKTRRPLPERLEPHAAVRLIESVRALRVFAHSHDVLVSGAFSLAMRSALSVYDALYATLALSQGFRLITADLALIREIRGFDREENVVPLADVARALRASPPG